MNICFVLVLVSDNTKMCHGVATPRLRSHNLGDTRCAWYLQQQLLLQNGIEELDFCASSFLLLRPPPPGCSSAATDIRVPSIVVGALVGCVPAVVAVAVAARARGVLRLFHRGVAGTPPPLLIFYQCVLMGGHW